MDIYTIVLTFQKFRDECNPVYEETFEYKGKQNDVGIRTLEIQVVSKKTFGWNPVLGMVSKLLTVKPCCGDICPSCRSIC